MPVREDCNYDNLHAQPFSHDVGHSDKASRSNHPSHRSLSSDFCTDARSILQPLLLGAKLITACQSHQQHLLNLICPAASPVVHRGNSDCPVRLSSTDASAMRVCHWACEEGRGICWPAWQRAEGDPHFLRIPGNSNAYLQDWPPAGLLSLFSKSFSSPNVDPPLLSASICLTCQVRDAFW